MILEPMSFAVNSHFFTGEDAVLKTIKHIPIIALTAYVMRGDKEWFLAEGFDDYVSKPMNVDRLMDSIKNVLN